MALELGLYRNENADRFECRRRVAIGLDADRRNVGLNGRIVAGCGQRRPRAFGSRADVARAEALLDEAGATVALLSVLVLTRLLAPSQFGVVAGIVVV